MTQLGRYVILAEKGGNRSAVANETWFQLRPAEHFGSYDHGGHYFTVVRHVGQYLIVNQEAKIAPARNGLRNCQTFMFVKMNVSAEDAPDYD